MQWDACFTPVKAAFADTIDEVLINMDRLHFLICTGDGLFPFRSGELNPAKISPPPINYGSALENESIRVNP